MVAPAVLAAMIGGGSLLGSTALTTFGGGSGSQGGLHEDDWHLWQKNYNMQKEFAKKGVSWKMDDTMASAKKHGISPLAALGQQGSQAIPQMVGSSKGYKESKADRAAKFISKAGSDISRTVANIPTSNQIRMENAQIRLAEAKAKGLEFHNLELENSINNNTQVPTSNNLGILESNLKSDKQLIRENPQRYKADSIGVQSGAVHGKQAMFDEFGNLDFGLNQLTSEAYESDPVNQLKMVKRQLARYGNLAWGKPINTPQGVIPFKTFVRKQAAFLNQKYRYSGYKIGYTPAERGFRLVKSSRVTPSGFIKSKATSYKVPTYRSGRLKPKSQPGGSGW